MVCYRIRLCLLGLFLASVPQMQAQQSVFTVVVASYPKAQDAQAVQQAAHKARLPAQTYYMDTPAGKRFRVCVGEYGSMREAMGHRDTIAEVLSSPDAWVLELPTGFAETRVDYDALPTLPSTPADSSLTASDTSLSRPAPTLDSLFLETYRGCLSAWLQNDLALLNTYLHPTAGLYVLYRNKGRYLARPFRTLQEFLESDALAELADLSHHLAQQLVYYTDTPSVADLPEYFCEGGREGYTSEGFFAGRPLPERILLFGSREALKQDYLRQSLTATEARTIAETEQTIEIGVVNTEALLLRGLYFGRVHGRWYLTVLDLVNPCE